MPHQQPLPFQKKKNERATSCTHVWIPITTRGLIWLLRRDEPVRRCQVRATGAVRDRSLRHRQVRVRPRVRAGNEAGMRWRRHHLSEPLRAQAAGLLGQTAHRARLRRQLRFQGALLRQGLFAWGSERWRIWWNLCWSCFLYLTICFKKDTGFFWMIGEFNYHTEFFLPFSYFKMSAVLIFWNKFY